MKSTSIYIRMPIELKQKLEEEVEKLNQKHPGANYTVSGLVRALIEKELEK